MHVGICAGCLHGCNSCVVGMRRHVQPPNTPTARSGNDCALIVKMEQGTVKKLYPFVLPADVLKLLLTHMDGCELARWRGTCTWFKCYIDGTRELRMRWYVHIQWNATPPRIQTLVSVGTFYLLLAKRVFEQRKINVGAFVDGKFDWLWQSNMGRSVYYPFGPETKGNQTRISTDGERVSFYYNCANIADELTRNLVFLNKQMPDIFQLRTFERRGDDSFFCFMGHENKTICAKEQCSCVFKQRFTVVLSFSVPSHNIRMTKRKAHHDAWLKEAYNEFSIFTL